jgi:hypothetical protein
MRVCGGRTDCHRGESHYRFTSAEQRVCSSIKFFHFMRRFFRSRPNGRRKRSTGFVSPRRNARRPSHSLRDRTPARQIELKAIARLRLGRCLKPRRLSRKSFRKPVDLAERKAFGVVSGHLALLDTHPMIPRHDTVSGLKCLEHKPSLSVSTTNCREVVLQRVEGHERIFDGRSVERHHSRRRKRRRPAFHPLIGRSRTAEARNANGNGKEREASKRGTHVPSVTGRNRTAYL